MIQGCCRGVIVVLGVPWVNNKFSNFHIQSTAYSVYQFQARKPLGAVNTVTCTGKPRGQVPAHAERRLVRCSPLHPAAGRSTYVDVGLETAKLKLTGNPS
jgi:hypothetical protein